MILFGHRGARAEAPENTLEGFAHAVRTGVNGIELDVRLSKDGQLVVIHDATVERTMHAEGAVGSFTARELAAMEPRREAGHPPPPARRSPVPGVPQLAEVLELVRRVPHLQLEIKPDALAGLEAIVSLLAREIERRSLGAFTVVTSFEPEALRLMRERVPAQRTALIGRRSGESFLARARALGCTGVCIHRPTGSREAVLRAHQLGLEVTGWLGNTEGEIAELVAWEVDGITSDRPSAAVAVLHGRGLL